MRLSGHFFLWIGFLSAAFCSVCRLEETDAPWSTVPWAWYGSSMFLGSIGVLILRRSNRLLQSDDAETQAEVSLLSSALAELAAAVDQLLTADALIPSDVLRRLDTECAEPFAQFAEARQALIRRFGLAVYAEVMTEFASAERYANRAWSAAADGYVDEVATSLRRAQAHLAAAEALLLAAQQSHELETRPRASHR